MTPDHEGLAALLARPSVTRVLAVLHGPGEETRIVGGAVRDALRGAPSADVDLATTREPRDVMARARAAGLKAIPTGIDHGTVTVIADGAPVEVTTLREDVDTDGRHATVRFGRDFAADAARRDFTINALSLGADGILYDTVGGLDDLAAGRVRFIGDAATRIREDYLRTLRFFRFHARFGTGAPDADGLAAAVAERDGVSRLSRERVRSEMLRLLVAPGVVAAAAVMAETGLLALAVGPSAGVDGLGGAVAFEARHGLAPDALRRLGALAVATPRDAETIAERLRLSRAEAARLLARAQARASLPEAGILDGDAVRRGVAEHGVAAAQDALATEPASRLDAGGRAALAAFRDGSQPLPAFPLAGADLLAAGASTGPGIGRALAEARRVWAGMGCPDGPEARSRLLDVARQAYARADEDRHGGAEDG